VIIHDVPEYVAQNLPRPTFYVPDVLAKGGSLMVFGAGGVRKSWLVQHLAFCLASGDAWLGWNTRQCKVLLVNFELPVLGQHWRLKQMSPNFRVDSNLLFESSCGHMALENEEQFSRFVNAISPYEFNVIILDCLRCFFKGDESKQEHVGRMTANFKLLQDANISLVVVHHENKNPEAIGSARMSGSTAWDGHFDTVVNLVKQPSGHQLRFTKNRWSMFDLEPVNIEFRDYLWLVRGENRNIRGGVNEEVATT
jgi:RecA-family ATPase